MEDIRTDEELEAIARESREPIYKAVATRGHGVMQTLRGLVREAWGKLEEEHQLEKKFEISPARFMNEVESKLKHDPEGQER
jgi:hypothetical protein